MRTRLLPLLIVLMAGVLLALGFPLAGGMAAVAQQEVVVDRIDDTARFAALAQYVTTWPTGIDGPSDERLITLNWELARYHELYGINAGVLYRDGTAMSAAPVDWRPRPGSATHDAFQEALAGRRSHDPGQVWPWQRGRLTVASPVIRDGDVVAVVVTDSPTGPLRARILHEWLVLAAGETAAMLLAVGAAFRLTGWVLRPVRTLDAAAHGIATGRLNSRVAADSGPPELRRLARSFNEMADNVEDVLEQQRAFVADASHQLRNPLSALLLRIDLLALDLPDGHTEVDSVRTEGKRLARVLDDLLDLALAEHAAADPQLTDIAELVADRIGAWSPVADREEVALACTGPAAVTGWADPIALSSALDAVIDNALKFTPAGSGVEVGVEVVGDRVHITVADEGPGLTEEELTRIGDRFWRSNRHQNVSGSGLGLSISRALLASGGATLSYARNEPTGLRATIAVPRQEPAAGA
ncbi:two-component sensor histidine kinase [Streptomyces mashuensis]|uniref:histidine kinase n=1 Tax=Streptomyces mashuensis TaxID=33904 RepID=A0A919AT29_9ACTN|nr:HAMP domain-containing sensor histidine kinase [Streptomyces mashuensis]GHF23812.1 two-component sensor histidine kinase [Streptomyces mashuensis]